MELDLQQLTTEVCRIATEAGNFLRKERRSFSRSVWWKSMRMTMCRMLIKNLNAC